ncbi:glycosyltransferase [Castellaniella sp.]|uniref:ArnT family glycosyltransferase n=1 Tax=Castellaniella sp. TaxID=1955812 RepID=UPI002AFF5A41|nr:glycosyltransferase [Castellaniella sp.]
MSTESLRSTPARLTATAAAKLPRLFLVTVGLVYILAGLFYRDPWKTDDVVSLATMLTALSGQDHAWLLPQVGQLAQAQDGPLVTWIGAACIWAFSPILEFFFSPLNAAIIASRLPNILWFAILTSAIWYGTYLLGRRPEAQPLALPFGGEPTERDYGRMLADAALLLIVATAGIIWRMHETSEVPAVIACQALAFYAVARMLDHPISGAVTLGVALGAAFLARGWLGSLPVLLACLFIFLRHGPLAQARQWLILSLLIGAGLALLWWIPARTFGPYWTTQWLRWSAHAFSWPSARAWLSIVRDLPWFLWPTWPLALLALWRWRGWFNAPHIRIPLGFALAAFAVLLANSDPFEPEYSMLAIPSAVLAAFALPTLRRGVINTLDWFAVMCFSLTAATVWLGWIALQTGWPGQIAANIARQTRGFDAYIVWPALLIAVLGTIAWIALVVWRLRSHPVGLWRGTALSAGGLLTTWLLLATLWMPALDYVRSYRDVSGALAQVLAQEQKPGECIRTQSLGSGQRASFLVFDRIEFRFDPQCPLLLQQLDIHSPEADRPSTPDHTILWEGRRGPDRHEMFRLVRTPPAS